MADAVRIRRDDSEMRDFRYGAHATRRAGEAGATAREPVTTTPFGASASSAGPDNTISVVEA